MQSRIRVLRRVDHQATPELQTLVAGRLVTENGHWQTWNEWPTMTRLKYFFLLLSLAIALPLFAQAPAQPAASRGQLLYETHCVACHDAQIHWRDRKLATDWASLAHQVRRWQANAGLDWNREETDAVVHYLNQRFYRFPDRAPKQTG